jgi:hypothetical protein
VRSGIICDRRNGNREKQPEQGQKVGQTLTFNRPGEGKIRGEGVEIEEESTSRMEMRNKWDRHQFKFEKILDQCLQKSGDPLYLLCPVITPIARR